MSEQIPDTLESLTSTEQMNRERMAQRMRTSVRGVETSPIEAACNPAVELVAKRALWRSTREEHLPAQRRGALLAQVVQDCFAYDASQR
jgi:hypothetical protein